MGIVHLYEYLIVLHRQIQVCPPSWTTDFLENLLLPQLRRLRLAALPPAGRLARALRRGEIAWRGGCGCGCDGGGGGGRSVARRPHRSHSPARTASAQALLLVMHETTDERRREVAQW